MSRNMVAQSSTELRSVLPRQWSRGENLEWRGRREIVRPFGRRNSFHLRASRGDTLAL